MYDYYFDFPLSPDVDLQCCVTFDAELSHESPDGNVLMNGDFVITIKRVRAKNLHEDYIIELSSTLENRIKTWLKTLKYEEMVKEI